MELLYKWMNKYNLTIHFRSDSPHTKIKFNVFDKGPLSAVK